MAEQVFQITSGGHSFGKKIYTSGSGVFPGRLVKYVSGSTVNLCDSASIPIGFAFGLRSMVYTPTTKEYATGEAIDVRDGVGSALASTDLFQSGTLPSANATLYVGDNGQMHTSGTYKIGRCIRNETRLESVGGVGASQSLAWIEFDISPLGTT